MTIFDDLVAVARERHFGHETVHATERPLCRISRIPHDWCLGCRRGWHKRTQLPLPGAEPEELDALEHRPQCPPTSACALCYPAPPLSEIVTDLAVRALGVPRERIDASALDAVVYVELNLPPEDAAALQLADEVRDPNTCANCQRTGYHASWCAVNPAHGG